MPIILETESNKSMKKQNFKNSMIMSCPVALHSDSMRSFW